MVIFNSYLYVYQRVYIYIYPPSSWLTKGGNFQRVETPRSFVVPRGATSPGGEMKRRAFWGDEDGRS